MLASQEKLRSTEIINKYLQIAVFLVWRHSITVQSKVGSEMVAGEHRNIHLSRKELYGYVYASRHNCYSSRRFQAPENVRFLSGFTLFVLIEDIEDFKFLRSANISHILEGMCTGMLET
jgi:hypothetical protein